MKFPKTPEHFEEMLEHYPKGLKRLLTIFANFEKIFGSCPHL